MTVYGYARCSTASQDHALQVAALRSAGVDAENLVTDTVAGAAKCRPLFDKLLSKLKPGDTLAVWKVDRLGRSSVDVMNRLDQLEADGVTVKITSLGVDTSTPAGRLVRGVLVQVAEFEREL